MGVESRPRERRSPSVLGSYRKARATEDKATPSLSQVAYDRFIEALFSRRLAAGAFLSQSDLVDLLEVPVGPLRDALRVLQTEGIVSIKARSGIKIVEPDLAMARHTYQIRTMLELPAVRIYAETAPMPVVLAHEQHHKKLLKRLDRSEPGDAEIQALDKLDPSLHLEIIGALRNPLVEDTYRRIQGLLNLILMERSAVGPMMIRTLNEHIKVLEACKARDPDAAEAAMGEHVALSLERAMTFL